MNICRHCKKNEGVTIDCRITRNGQTRCYYTCNECNSRRSRKYRETTGGKEAYRRIQLKQVRKFHEKKLAREKLYYAVKKGYLEKPIHCSVCHEHKKLDAHHEDYNKPLEVTWLCRLCHRKVV